MKFIKNIMKKKFLTLSIIMLLMATLLVPNTYSAEITSAKITITASKNEYKAGDTIEFTISLKDLQASNGILGLGAYINYDSNLLTLNNVAKGLSDWSDAEISTKTNRFATTKNSHSSNNEDILLLSFTAKTVSSDTKTSISLQKIEISNGTEYKIEEMKSNEITIKPASSTPSDNPSDNPDHNNESDKPNNPSDSENNNNTNTQNNNSNTNTNSQNGSGNSKGQNNSNKNLTTGSDDKKSSSYIPKLGSSEFNLLLVIFVVAIVALFFVARIKIIDKKIEEEERKKFINNNDKKDE